jgi:hypothetical protein
LQDGHIIMTILFPSTTTTNPLSPLPITANVPVGGGSTARFDHSQ